MLMVIMLGKSTPSAPSTFKEWEDRDEIEDCEAMVPAADPDAPERLVLILVTVGIMEPSGLMVLLLILMVVLGVEPPPMLLSPDKEYLVLATPEVGLVTADFFPGSS